MKSRIPLILALLLFPLLNETATLAQPFTGSVTEDQWCDLAPSPCGADCANSSPFTLTISDAPPNATGDATITLEFLGDMDNPTDENLTVSVEGFEMGMITNGVPDDDLFGHPTDYVSDCAPVTISGTIPLASLDSILVNGNIDVTFTPDQVNNDIEAGGCPDPRETMTVTVQYPLQGVPTLPLGALALLVCTLMLIGVYFSRSLVQ